MAVIEEGQDQGDWMKSPSEMLLGLPKGTDPIRWLEEQGRTDTLLYRRLKANFDFKGTMQTQEHGTQHDEKTHGRRGGGSSNGDGGGGTGGGGGPIGFEVEGSPNSWESIDEQVGVFDDNQRVSMMSYKMGGYRAINDKLRTGEVAAVWKKRVSDEIAGLDSVLGESKLGSDMTLYRGTRNEAVGAGGLDFDAVKPGMTYRDKAFLSTSVKKTLAVKWAKIMHRDKGVLIEIRAKKGQSAVSLKAHSNDNEGEILLPRDQEFTIVSKGILNGVPHVVMEVK